MKTRRNIYGGLMLAAAALLCLAGCKKDEEGEKVVLGVDFEQTAGMQKTYIGNGERTIYWNTGDSVKINGTVCEVHDGAVEVTLSDDGYAAVYPKTGTLNGNGSGKNCTGGSVEIPAVQTYTAVDGVQRLDGPMAARLDSRTGRLLFRNLYAVIKVKVKAGSSDFTLNSITLESTNNKILSGTENFNFVQSKKTGKTDSVEFTYVSGSTGVTLTGIDSTIPANDSASFYLYTVPFSGADLNVRVNGRVENRTPARTGITISRSQLRGTTVDVSNLDPIRFSVAADRYVTFSPGNLQWSATNGGTTPTTHVVADGTAVGTWRFAERQWDYIGSANSNISSTYTGWIDLFGWGTSGYNNKYPYSTAIISDYYGDGGNSIAGTNYDWGVYNAIYNPRTGQTDPAGTWRTLTSTEWNYLLKDKWWHYDLVVIQEADGINNVQGLLIYPDGVTTADLPAGVPGGLTQEYKKVITPISKTYFDKLEAMGCVFLPVTGQRYSINENNPVDNTETGIYWLSTSKNEANAYNFFFNINGLYEGYSNYYYGYSVRLVKDVQ